MLTVQKLKTQQIRMVSHVNHFHCWKAGSHFAAGSFQDTPPWACPPESTLEGRPEYPSMGVLAGKPKVVEQNITCDLLPPLSPPPAALFSYLSPGRSRCEKAGVKDADTARSIKLQWFWKRAGRRRQRTSAIRTDTESLTGSEYYSSFDRKEFVSSFTSSNASSSSTSSTSGSSLVYSRIKDAQVHGISLRWVRWLCTTWHNGAFVSRTNRR